MLQVALACLAKEGEGSASTSPDFTLSGLLPFFGHNSSLTSA